VVENSFLNGVVNPDFVEEFSRMEVFGFFTPLDWLDLIRKTLKDVVNNSPIVFNQFFQSVITITLRDIEGWK